MSTQIDSSIPILTEVLYTPTSNSIQPQSEQEDKQKEEKIEALRRKMQNVKMEELIQNNQNIEINSSKQNEAIIDSIENAEKWQELELTLKENILRQVLARVDFILEHKIRDSLAEVLQNSVDKLANDIQLGLKNSLEDVVTRAVSQEIAKIKIRQK
jgi:predicted transcriptional regulator